MIDFFAGLEARNIVIAAVLIGIFFLLRVIVLWYWRVNHIVERLDIIISELKKISKKERLP